MDLREAIRTSRESPRETPVDILATAAGSVVPVLSTPADDARRCKISTKVEHPTEQAPPGFTEHSNAEDYEFDESQDFDNSIDGMGFLTVDNHKAGYTGPQSGIAALKFLQSLPLYLPLNSSNTPSSLDEDDFPTVSSHTGRTIRRYIDEYFTLYHPAYPILHEGTFRARVSGAWYTSVPWYPVRYAS